MFAAGLEQARPWFASLGSSTFSSSSSILGWIATALITYCLWEQLRFWWLRQQLASGKHVSGPFMAVPLVGCLVSMVLDPYRFWEEQRMYSFPGFSWNSIFGKFMVFVTDAELSRQVLSVNGKDSLLMALHPSAKNILGEQNLAFMHGPEHKAIRKSFLSLFTRKALGTYVEIQDGIIRRHIAQWLQELHGEVEIRNHVRDLNAFTSQEVFAGPYLDEPGVANEVSEAYRNITNGFLAFPLCIPGTAVWKGKQGRLYILKTLRGAAARAKAAMQTGQAPKCLMDFWALRCLEEVREAEAAGEPAPRHTGNPEMADTVMDFLFASQDASTASLVWMIVLMAEHPDVLEKVRAEQAQLRPEPDATITGAVLNEMVYTRQVVKEVLRFRPPAPMVPQWAQQDYKLTDNFTAPKGSLIMPSLISASMQGFTDSDKFDPDRFSSVRKEDVKFAKNYLVFGHGPHYCVGKEYAVNQLTCYLAILATSCNWTRRKTCSDDSNWKYLPTIYPNTSLITLSARNVQAAAA